LTIRCRVHNQ